MKKALVLLGIVLSSTTVVLAQNVSFGVKGGVNMADISTDGPAEYDTKVGFHVGGLAHIHISKHFAVQPELLYSTQGADNGNGKLKFNYINVPVLAQYMTGSGFRFQTGPQIGIMTTAKSKVAGVEVDISEAVSTVDFGWAFGASYMFSGGIGVDARYNLGITDVNENPTVEDRNRVIQLGIFYQFARNNRPHKK